MSGAAEGRAAVEPVDYLRQLGICNPRQLREGVTIVGVGGIGGPTALILAKMGVETIDVWDHDTVEGHNVPNQLYGRRDIGALKVEALARTVEALTGCRVTQQARRFEPTAPTHPIVVLAVDTMAARREIWDAVWRRPETRLVIDTRMGAELGRVLVVNLANPDHARWYQETLYSDAEAVEAPCTARAIVYTGFAIAAHVAALVKRRAMEQEVPFDTTIDFPNGIWLSDTVALSGDAREGSRVRVLEEGSVEA